MPIDATFHGLHDWYRKSFEKFGWMFLAENRGDLEKVKCYNRMVEHLVEALENKIKNITNKENIDDLTIMLNNSKILQTKSKNLQDELEKSLASGTNLINKEQKIISKEDLNISNKTQSGGRSSKRGSKRGSRRGSRRGSKRGSKRG